MSVRFPGLQFCPSPPLLLVIPKTRLRSGGDRAFSSYDLKLWNSLPADIREANSLSIFKSRELGRPWRNRELGAQWRHRQSREPWRASLRGLGLGPRPDPYSPPKKIPWGKLGVYRPGWVLEEPALEGALGLEQALEGSLGLEPTLERIQRRG